MKVVREGSIEDAALKGRLCESVRQKREKNGSEDPPLQKERGRTKVPALHKKEKEGAPAGSRRYKKSGSFVALGMTTFGVSLADDCRPVGAGDRSKRARYIVLLHERKEAVRGAG